MEKIGDQVSKVVASLPKRELSEMVRAVCEECGFEGRLRPKGEPLPKLCNRCKAKKRFELGLAQRLEGCGIPQRFHGARLDDLHPEISKGAQSWLHEETTFVLLHGPTGTSKSHAAAASLYEVARETSDALWVTVPYASMRLRRLGSQAEELMDQMTKTHWMVLDDLGSERPTDYVLESLACVVIVRWDNMLPTFVTSNVSPDKLHELHPRMASRLCSGFVRELQGQDQRLQGS